MTLKRISPLVPVVEMERSVAFFRDVLGFSVGVLEDGYAYLHREGVSIRLIEAAPDVDIHDEKRQMACYVDVDGVDALYESMRPALDTLPPGRVRAPFDQDYGMREFHVIDEGCLLLFFGEPIR